MPPVFALAPRLGAGEISSEVDYARGLDGRPALALAEVDHADAWAEREGDGLAEVEEAAARELAARPLPKWLRVLDGEANPEVATEHGAARALQREVGSEA
eukprot:6957258-Alexandrium_andersonii.AAC.1